MVLPVLEVLHPDRSRLQDQALAVLDQEQERPMD
jgi:hypothetical protein